ncbi:MAG: hypothetical protein QS748_13120 [Candidatus Endonucleobacter bathymodioli]|uniref:Uncharacterized protein n=1 Tax=Candidatus Endonucleibacter bathymodioli TaxID=539814 RepID=A0AA90SE45_9GAMM|nr:hypothetical protein [Candidatus Endonucleobacter bathymodioli]
MILNNINCRLKASIAALSLLLASTFVQAGDEFIAAYDAYQSDGPLSVVNIPKVEVRKFLKNLDANLSQVQPLLNEMLDESNQATGLCVAIFRIGLKGRETDERYFDTHLAKADSNKDYDQYRAVGIDYRQDFLTYDMVEFITDIIEKPVKDVLSHLSTKATGPITVKGYEFGKLKIYVNGHDSLWEQKLTAPPEFAKLERIKSTIQMSNPNEMSAIIFNDTFKNILVDIILSYLKDDSVVFSRTPGTKVPSEEISLAFDSSGAYSRQALKERLDEFWRCTGELELLELDSDSIKNTVSSGDNEVAIECNEAATRTGPALVPVALAAISHIFPNMTNKSNIAVPIEHLKTPLRIAMQTLVSTCYSSNQTEFNRNFYAYNQCLIEMTGERYQQSVDDSTSRSLFLITSRSLFLIKEKTPLLQVVTVISQALTNLQNFLSNDPHYTISPVMGLGIRIPHH